MPWLNLTRVRLRNWTIFFLLYCIAQLCVRVLFGHKMNIDEAQVWLWAHELAWGYGPQPPLYVWLQRAVFAMTGATDFGLAVLKEFLLFGIFVMAQELAGRWTDGEKIPRWFAGAAALMLFWLPEFSWESQRIHTHNVLTTLVSLLTIWQALHLRETPTHKNYALLGLLIGAGMLSKWSFGFVALGTIVVLILERHFRLLGWKILAWCIGLPALMILPTVIWIINHPAVALASYHKLGVAPELHWYFGILAWTTSASMALIVFVALPLLVFGAFMAWGRTPYAELPTLSNAAQDEIRFVARCVALALATLLIGGAFIGATVLKYRWLLPILIPFVPASTFLVLIRLQENARRWLLRLTFVLPAMLVILWSVTLINKTPLKYFDDSFVAPALPENDDRSPYLASVTMAAHLKVVDPDRILKDEALLMAGACPDMVTVLESSMLQTPGLMDWLSGCGLVRSSVRSSLLGENSEVTVFHFVTR